MVDLVAFFDDPIIFGMGHGCICCGLASFLECNDITVTGSFIAMAATLLVPYKIAQMISVKRVKNSDKGMM